MGGLPWLTVIRTGEHIAISRRHTLRMQGWHNLLRGKVLTTSLCKIFIKISFQSCKQKNQQELDLLDDIRNFMKQRAAIEKLYADGLIKLSSVYGTKKIANLEDVKIEDDQPTSGEHNVYIIWKKMLEENEKIAKALLAAIQV